MESFRKDLERKRRGQYVKDSNSKCLVRTSSTKREDGGIVTLWESASLCWFFIYIHPQALLEEVERVDADVFAFQEFTHPVLKMFLENDFIRENYVLSHNEIKVGYVVFMIVHKRVEFFFLKMTFIIFLIS